MGRNGRHTILDYFSKWGTLKKGHEEDLICHDMCNYIRQHVLNGTFNGIFFHVENETGGKRSAVYNLTKKVTGKIAGAPDYVFMNKEYHLLIEIKTSDGRQSKEQRAFEKWCIDNGVKYYLCRSAEDAIEILKKYNFFID